MLMQNLGGQTKSIMVFSEVAYWIRLCKDRVHWNDFIHDWMILPHISNLFVRGKARNDIFGNGQLKFTVDALRIELSPQGNVIRDFVLFLASGVRLASSLKTPRSKGRFQKAKCFSARKHLFVFAG